MANFKLMNYEGTPDTFTFPNNSTTFEDASEFEAQRTDVPFDNKHIFITKGSMRPKVLTLQGYFTGANKRTNYANLLKKCSSPQLKKFLFDEDRFYIVLSPQFKKTHSGGRTNFLDYVGSLVTPIPFIFGALKYDYYTGTWNFGTETNEGSHKTFIQQIDVTFTGAGTNETFSVQDAYNGGITIKGLTHATGDKLTIKLLTMVDSNGYKTTEYWYATFYDDSAGTTTQVQRSVATGKSELDLVLEPGDNITSFTFTGSTITNYQAEFYWRDSYID